LRRDADVSSRRILLSSQWGPLLLPNRQARFVRQLRWQDLSPVTGSRGDARKHPHAKPQHAGQPTSWRRGGPGTTSLHVRPRRRYIFAVCSASKDTPPSYPGPGFTTALAAKIGNVSIGNFGLRRRIRSSLAEVPHSVSRSLEDSERAPKGLLALHSNLVPHNSIPGTLN